MSTQSVWKTKLTFSSVSLSDAAKLQRWLYEGRYDLLEAYESSNPEAFTPYYNLSKEPSQPSSGSYGGDLEVDPHYASDPGSGYSLQPEYSASSIIFL